MKLEEMVNKVICGDCLDIMTTAELKDWQEWAEDEIIEYQEFISDILEELDKRVIK